MLSFSPRPLDLAPQRCELGPTLRKSRNIKQFRSRLFAETNVDAEGASLAEPEVSRRQPVAAASAPGLGVPGSALSMEA
jgi:hypothetical protein